MSCNITVYYQILNLLNSKNNIVVIFCGFLLLEKSVHKKPTYPTAYIIYTITILIHYCTCDDIYKNILESSIVGGPNLNINLINGLMLVHPIVLYYFYTIHLYVYKVILLKKVSKGRKILITESWGGGLQNSGLVIIYISIILGCWWAEQELAWGGWWSWDFVELLALNFFLFSLIVLHKNNNQKVGGVISWVATLILSVVLVRFNIINSIHNFIVLESQNQYFYYIMLIIVFAIFLIVTSLNNNKLVNKPYGKEAATVKNRILLLNPSTTISLVCLLFYIVFLLNLIKIDYNTQISIKYIYLNIFCLALTILYSKKTNIGNGLIGIFFFLLNLKIALILISWQIQIQLVDYLFLGLITCYIYIKSEHRYNTVKSIHIYVLILLFLTIKQIYVFSEQYLLFKTDFVVYLKTTQQITLHNNVYEFINSNIIHVAQNIRLYLAGLNDATFKIIFEKTLFLTNNDFVELYSYNNQKLNQPTTALACFFYLALLTYPILKLNKKRGAGLSF